MIMQWSGCIFQVVFGHGLEYGLQPCRYVPAFHDAIPAVLSTSIDCNLYYYESSLRCFYNARPMYCIFFYTVMIVCVAWQTCTVRLDHWCCICAVFAACIRSLYLMYYSSVPGSCDACQVGTCLHQNRQKFCSRAVGPTNTLLSCLCIPRTRIGQPLVMNVSFVAFILLYLLLGRSLNGYRFVMLMLWLQTWYEALCFSRFTGDGVGVPASSKFMPSAPALISRYMAGYKIAVHCAEPICMEEIPSFASSILSILCYGILKPLYYSGNVMRVSFSKPVSIPDSGKHLWHFVLRHVRSCRLTSTPFNGVASLRNWLLQPFHFLATIIGISILCYTCTLVNSELSLQVCFHHFNSYTVYALGKLDIQGLTVLSLWVT